MPTTPDVLTLNKIFNEMVKKNCEYGVNFGEY